MILRIIVAAVQVIQEWYLAGITGNGRGEVN